MPHKNTSVWLSRVLFESALITISIVVALALDEWRDNRQDQQIVEHAMENFLAEGRLRREDWVIKPIFPPGRHQSSARTKKQCPSSF